IILPGTKSTISDLEYLKKTGLADAVRTLVGTVPICGICGGYQMLGTYISDPYEIEGGGETEGLGLLPTRTVMAKDKKTVQTEGVFEDLAGVFAALNGMAYRGYEIHQGVTETLPVQADEQAPAEIFGTYIHGVFDREGIAETLVNELLSRKGAEKTEAAGLDYDRFKAEQYDILADALEQALDIGELKRIMGM
ncbi:MAG: cobyric acid synthase CobQ, partial [Lachnospiraceae bacterium]|nr:cobyric acid synthase CobQ [Lachnospiraceae bacterium]